VLQSADGKIRVLRQTDAAWQTDRAREEIATALQELPPIDFIWAHDDAMARGAAQACRSAGHTEVRVVGINAVTDGGRKEVADGLLDATFERPTCGAAAIDLALLAVSGIPTAQNIPLGSRLFTRANLAAGGELVIAPGDFALANMLRQHANVLTTTPATDVVFRLGVAQWSDESPWRRAMRADLEAAAGKYPQIALSYRDAGGSLEQQRAIVREFIAQNFNSILIAPGMSSDLTTVCQEAIAAGIKVIVVGHRLQGGDYTCHVGADESRIGHAAGRYIAEMLGPEGGTIIELQGAMASPSAQKLDAGFTQALGLKRP